MKTQTNNITSRLDAYDDDDFQRRFVSQDESGFSQTTLLIGGITCAGCVRGIERKLGALPGLQSVSVNSATSRAEIAWDREALPLSKIIGRVFEIGYEAFPFEPHERQQAIEKERKSVLIRLGLACLFGMQIMMFTIALYSGEWLGIQTATQNFLRWTTLILSIPMVTYAALPFYRGAIRSLRSRILGMDIPVSLAIVIAFAASLTTMMRGNGDVYFESIAMFVTLLLASRFFETNARIKASRVFDRYAKAIPNLATRLTPDGVVETIAVSKIAVGDHIIVKVGEIAPVDGEVLFGQTAMNESILTGESDAKEKQLGDMVLSGSVNLQDTVQIRASRLVENSFISEISKLTQRSQGLKPRASLLADRIASWFILGVLVIAAFTAFYWSQTDPGRALSITIAVLVICCPCALALATPTAMTVASTAMLKRGIALVNPNVLETLARSTFFIFDKTGTLTEGKLQLQRVHICQGESAKLAKQIASSLAQYSEHHVASALVDDSFEQMSVTNFQNHLGRGISGTIGNNTYWLGSAVFATENANADLRNLRHWRSDNTTAYLVRGSTAIACFEFSDQVRLGAADLIEFLAKRRVKLSILSGDTDDATSRVAHNLKIDNYKGQLTPQNKLDLLQEQLAKGENIVVVGDGVNDAPMLAQSMVAVAVGNATDLTKLNADMVLLGDDLSVVRDAVLISQRTASIIKQNMAWAIGYNACALPLAIIGLVPPWLAAIGMSLSSLIVVINATRVGNVGKPVS